jgi:hypothetical protein
MMAVVAVRLLVEKKAAEEEIFHVHEQGANVPTNKYYSRSCCMAACYSSSSSSWDSS